MNKKGLFSLGQIIVGFALVGIIMFFAAVFVFESGEEYVIGNIANVGKDVIGENTVSSVNSSVNPTINTVQSDYSGFALPYDLFFLMAWILTFSFTIWLAFKANKSGIFEFFGLLFIGTLLMLLISTYVSDFVSWFLSEIFNKVFSDATISMPIFLFYLSNLGLINFIWWLILVLVNIIDKTFISRTGEVEE